ncbi:MAG: hypothetical protein B7Y56_02950 [Gallionellales bacterium 35-53-114]|jgi:hypothetical protein|nr:MAG: hypothetical protein B7Y56_02950 [Gallionellales bacterium 35-53-114]OYZ65065.1 MAG: hypothetical protein B7Y04_00110 [Gallionellales bacterium 24-53-125]OZB07974.1 MAG: hypothetical protein B7X61_10560 [Gallionellales bacterium 39-52-133]HQS59714.1 hypothetical protein [Gallionellaceae bacterium]HQS76468.1 hypothetical protein [Gallionellaceae bacterium]
MKPYPYRIKVALDCIIILVVFCLGAAVGCYFISPLGKSSTEKWTPAQPAPQVAAIPKQTIKPPVVKVYAHRAKQKLNLPEEIHTDPNLYVLQSTRLPNDTHPATVTTLIDQHTGQVQTIVRREPLPWFATEHTGEARIDVGIKSTTGTIARLTLREDLLQVKALHAGINASLDTDGQLFAGIGIGFKW